jgi:hypothetical protein
LSARSLSSLRTDGVVVMDTWPCPVAALKAWLEAAGITTGPVFRSVKKGGALAGRLPAQSVAEIVKAYAERVTAQTNRSCTSTRKGARRFRRRLRSWRLRDACRSASLAVAAGRRDDGARGGALAGGWMEAGRGCSRAHSRPTLRRRYFSRQITLGDLNQRYPPTQNDCGVQPSTVFLRLDELLQEGLVFGIILFLTTLCHLPSLCHLPPLL